MKTPYAKVDKLIEILGRREDRMFKLFCGVLKDHNSNLFDLLNKNEGEHVVIIRS